MSGRTLIELPNGSKVLFGGDGHSGGLTEVGIDRHLGAVGVEKLQSALGALAGVVEAMQHAVEKMAKRPEKIEMEFSASMKADCDLWIVSGEGEAEFKVTLSWGRD